MSSSLFVNNSLCVDETRTKFESQVPGVINWYGCGPTVYDSSHMGHARNYVTFDILRRLLEEYFNYEVNMCMNVTDIDDKIINRSRELGISWLDLSRYYENEFWKNMRDMKCKLPDSITRVSEYVDQIIVFIKKIIDNGYGYESNGSVYFDIETFRAKYQYGKMEPWSVNDSDRVLEGEGSLVAATTAGEKKCNLDFVLWKKSKANEPQWESPWGLGRPGWHIECSTMASDVLGFPIDIHSGGIDLRFPHHDNELAQTEACFDKEHWVKYFLHSGHLHIHGLKMSKSIKNFISIDHILKELEADGGAAVLRIYFLIHRWDQPINYNPDGSSFVEPKTIHKILRTFFSTAKQIVRRNTALNQTWTQPGDVAGKELTGINASQLWTESDRNLFNQYSTLQQKIHQALCDNFDTPKAVELIQELISNSNIYMDSQREAAKGPLLLKIATYIHKLLKAFGLAEGEVFSYGDESASAPADSRFGEVVDVLGAFRRDVRDRVRSLFKAGDPKAVAKDILTACDEVRDTKLTPLGVQLEDQGVNGFRWKEIGRSATTENKVMSQEE